MARLRPHRVGRAIFAATIAGAAGCALLADIESVRYDAITLAEAGPTADAEVDDERDATVPSDAASSPEAGSDDAGPSFCQTVTGVRFCSEFRDGSAEGEGWKVTQFPPSSRAFVDTSNEPPSPPFAAQAIHNGTTASPAWFEWTAPAANFAGGFVFVTRVRLFFDNGPFLAVRFGSDPGCILTFTDSKVSVSGNATGTFSFSPMIVSKDWVPIRLEAAFVSSTTSQITLQVGSATALVQTIACGGVVNLRDVRFGVLTPKDAGNTTIVQFDDVTVSNRN